MYLADLNSNVTEQAKILLISLKAWLQNFPDNEGYDKYNIAFDSVNRALLETRKYQKVLREGQPRNGDDESRLSSLWTDASFQIRPFDAQLADLCMVKGHGWADSKVWSMPKYRDLPIEVDQMLSHLTNLSQRNMTMQEENRKKQERLLAFVFGVSFIVVILILAIFFPTPTDFQYDVFKIVLALAAAGVAVNIPGFLHVEVNKFIRAGGAIAVFVIVFFFTPAQIAVKKVPNPDTVNITLPTGTHTLKAVAEYVEDKKRIIIIIDTSCSQIMNAIVEGNGNPVHGESIKDWFNNLKNRIRTPISYTVKEISKNERYEISCP